LAALAAILAALVASRLILERTPKPVSENEILRVPKPAPPTKKARVEKPAKIPPEKKPPAKKAPAKKAGPRRRPAD
jgi:hypothetical protein